MSTIPQPNEWLLQIFDAAAANGGVVRRSVADVTKYGGGKDALLTEVRRRNFHLVETGDQFVVLCNDGAIQLHC